jgi:hypothetical protein
MVTLSNLFVILCTSKTTMDNFIAAVTRFVPLFCYKRITKYFQNTTHLVFNYYSQILYVIIWSPILF